MDRWLTTEKIPLLLHLKSGATPITGASPEVTIIRHRTASGDASDGYYWNGSAFVVTPTTLAMTEVDSVNIPGVYEYLFDPNSSTAYIYLVIYENSTPDIRAFETLKVVTPDYEASSFPDVFQITITIDDGTSPIQGATVAIFDATNTTFIASNTTDANGQFTVALTAGSFKVRILAQGYTFTVPEDLTVSADGAETYSGVGATVTPPSAADLCTVYGTLRDVSGTPYAGECVQVYAITPQTVSGVQKHELLVTTNTNNNGYFEIELVRGTTVRVKIDGAGYDEEQIVPDLASQDITTW